MLNPNSAQICPQISLFPPSETKPGNHLRRQATRPIPLSRQDFWTAFNHETHQTHENRQSRNRMLSTAFVINRWTGTVQAKPLAGPLIMAGSLFPERKMRADACSAARKKQLIVEVVLAHGVPSRSFRQGTFASGWYLLSLRTKIYGLALFFSFTLFPAWPT